MDLMLRRRELLKMGGGLLPSGYTELEYLESANKSVTISTYNSGDTFVVDAVSTGAVASNKILLCYGSAAGRWIGAASNGYWGLGAANYLSIPCTTRTTLSVTFTTEKAILSANETSVERNGGAQSGSIQIFGFNGNIPFTGKIFSVKKVVDNVLVEHFVPCIEDATNKVGLYDIINQIFVEY